MYLVIFSPLAESPDPIPLKAIEAGSWRARLQRATVLLVPIAYNVIDYKAVCCWARQDTSDISARGETYARGWCT